MKALKESNLTTNTISLRIQRQFKFSWDYSSLILIVRSYSGERVKGISYERLNAAK